MQNINMPMYDNHCTHSHAGGHLGRDKTLDKICSRFYWKNMTEDIKLYVQQCDKCQRSNAKFTKSGAQLHPIPVEPKVWQPVSVLQYLYILHATELKLIL